MAIRVSKKFLGFTLIELLFVIAIIGVLATLGMALMQQQAQKTKIEKTALQMQQILQAASAYYIDNKCWPNNGINPQTGSPCIGTPPAFSTYLPIGALSSAGYPTSPWGSEYRWGSVGEKFRVCTVSQDSTSGYQTTISQQAADRIAGLLPNASSYATLDSCISYAPGSQYKCAQGATNCLAAAEIQMPNNGLGYVLTNGTVSVLECDATHIDNCLMSDGTAGIANKFQISVNNTCPATMQADIIISPIRYEPARESGDNVIESVPMYGSNFSSSGCKINDSGENCVINIAFQHYLDPQCGGSTGKQCMPTSALVSQSGRQDLNGNLTLGYSIVCDYKN